MRANCDSISNMEFLGSKQLRSASGKRRWAAAPNRPEYSLMYYAKLSALFFLLGAVTELGMIGSGNFFLLISFVDLLGYYKINMDSVEEIDKALRKHKESYAFRYRSYICALFGLTSSGKSFKKPRIKDMKKCKRRN